MKKFPIISGILFIADIAYLEFGKPQTTGYIVVAAIVLGVATLFFFLAFATSNCARDDERLEYNRILQAEQTCQCGETKRPDMAVCHFCAQVERSRFVHANPPSQCQCGQPKEPLLDRCDACINEQLLEFEKSKHL